MEKRLFQKLEEYGEGEFYPFHMPGHKRKVSLIEQPYSIDITEINGFDNLHHPEGILKESMDEAAKLYGVKQSFYLVNGTTCGLLASLESICKIGDKILIDRGCHKAVYHGIIERDLKPEYFYKRMEADFDGNVSVPEISPFIPEDSSAVVVTSPTYEGVIIPLQKLVKAAHEKGIPVIVDEAHGAHLPFWREGKYSAVNAGADIVVQSLHKTLPSMTQTSILHVQGNLVDVDRIREGLAVYQTSSPSYVFMASIENCLAYVSEDENIINRHMERMEKWRSDASKLEHVWILKGDGIDPSRLTIAVDGFSGQKLMEVFRDRYHLEMEMCSRDYVIAITTICDTDQGLSRLLYALWELNMEASAARKIPVLGVEWQRKYDNYQMNPYEAKRLHGYKKVLFSESENCICADMVTVYPPGIPFFVPGELLDAEGIAQVESYIKEGFEVNGVEEGYIKVIDRDTMEKNGKNRDRSSVLHG